VVLDILLAGLEPTVEVTEREVDRVEALSDELRRFAEVEAGQTGVTDAGLHRERRLPERKSCSGRRDHPSEGCGQEQP
jgi:hypothetical protein